jgi:hypothetical protein
MGLLKTLQDKEKLTKSARFAQTMEKLRLFSNVREIQFDLQRTSRPVILLKPYFQILGYLTFSLLSSSSIDSENSVPLYDDVQFAGGVELNVYLYFLELAVARRSLISVLPWFSTYLLHIPPSSAR